MFPLNGTVHVTITNADYDFAVQLPIRKRVLDFQKQSAFSFLIEQVQQTENGWEIVNVLPEQMILVTDDQDTETLLTIGYRSNMEGVFFYRIAEQQGTDSYLYDQSTFLVEVTVSDGVGEITAIYRNGIKTEQVLFVNRAVTSLTVTKTVKDAVTSTRFPFTVEIYLNGDAFPLPPSDENSGYTVDGNVLSFSLGHGESITLPCIPIGAVVNVREQSNENFLTYHKLQGVDETQISNAYREIPFSNTPQTIHFTNQSGFRLPNTGGMGTYWHTAVGAAITSAISAALLYRRSRRERRKNGPPKQ